MSLQDELGIEPAPETAVLYQAIQTDALPAPDISPVPLHNLPRALTPLFGRAEEIERLNNRLLNPAYPLISVTGPGGMGETSLALAAGHHLSTGQDENGRGPRRTIMANLAILPHMG